MSQNENENSQKTISGHVDRVVFRDPTSGKNILSVVREGGKSCRVIGFITDIEVGNNIIATGRWNKDEKFGWQFMAESIQVVLQTNYTDVVEDGQMHALDFSNVLNNSLKGFRHAGIEDDPDSLVQRMQDSDNEQKEDANYIFVDGALYSRDKTKLIYVPKNVTSFVIPETVTFIGKRAFIKSKLESIVIPESVITIGDGAFSYCSELKKVIIPSSVEHIGNWAFYGCSNLVVEVPDTVMHIGKDAFGNCKGYVMDKTFDVDWADVEFNSGYIRVPGPFNRSVIINDEHSDEKMGSLRRYFVRMIPCLTVHLGNNGEATIVNVKELHEIVIALQIKTDLTKLIREGQSTTEILKRIDALPNVFRNAFVPRDKTPYIEFLLDKHAADKYPLVPIEEYIGGSREEGVLYTIMIGNQPNIVWENNNDARASYVFRCTEETYIETRQQVFDYIMAEVPRKRKLLSSNECLTIFKEKPRMVIHNNLASWSQRLMSVSGLEFEFETAEATTTPREQGVGTVSESSGNPIYKTEVCVEDIEGELGELTYQEYEISVNAFVKADYYKIFGAEKQLLLSCTFTVSEIISFEFDDEMSECDREDFAEEGNVDDIINDLGIRDFDGLSSLDFFASGVPASGEGMSAEEIGGLLSDVLDDAGLDWDLGKFICTEQFSKEEPSGDF